MLVLSRKVGEQVYIGDSVCVTVVAVRGNKIRLGITAPPEIAVLRSEAVDRQKPEASSAPHSDARAESA